MTANEAKALADSTTKNTLQDEISSAEMMIRRCAEGGSYGYNATCDKKFRDGFMEYFTSQGFAIRPVLGEPTGELEMFIINWGGSNS